MNTSTERYTVVIIEPRKHKAFKFIIKNILDNLDNNWDIQIFHGINNKNYIENIININFINFSNRFFFENLNIDNITPYPQEYNRLFTDHTFYDKIRTETFLIFHLDAMILFNNKNNIYNFLKYDYVGAPWIDIPAIFHGITVGNGGLSLRKKSKMIEIINNYLYDGSHEDYYFSKHLYHNGYNIPSVKEAEDFSSELILSPTSFGIHSPWLHHSIDNIAKIYNIYMSDIMELIELQGCEN